MTSPTIQESFASKPTAQFPVGIAAIRVQAPYYRSYSTDQEGGVFNGQNYSVMLVKEAEDDADFKRLEKLPDVAGIIGISRLLLPPHLRSEQDLREAAARLKAEMVLIYTFDTTFHENDAALAFEHRDFGAFADPAHLRPCHRLRPGAGHANRLRLCRF